MLAFTLKTPFWISTKAAAVSSQDDSMPKINIFRLYFIKKELTTAILLW